MDKRGLSGLGGIVGAVVLLWQGFGLGEMPPPLAAATPAADPHREILGPRGAGSCSATACHGGMQPAEGKILRNEHTLWITRDKHADAYRVLTNARSKSIAARAAIVALVSFTA